jgi:hypothetical protein
VCADVFEELAAAAQDLPAHGALVEAVSGGRRRRPLLLLQLLHLTESLLKTLHVAARSLAPMTVKVNIIILDVVNELINVKILESKQLN